MNRGVLYHIAVSWSLGTPKVSHGCLVPATQLHGSSVLQAVFHWGHIKLFIDGNLVASREDLPRQITLADGPDHVLHVGHDVRYPYGANRWYGQVADLRIYKYSADQDEITAAAFTNPADLNFRGEDPCSGVGLEDCKDDAGSEASPIILKILDDGSFPKQISNHERFCRSTRFPNERENPDLFENGAAVLSCKFDGPFVGFVSRRRNFTEDFMKAQAPYLSDGGVPKVNEDSSDTDRSSHGVGYLLSLRRTTIQDDFWNFRAVV